MVLLGIALINYPTIFGYNSPLGIIPAPSKVSTYFFGGHLLSGSKRHGKSRPGVMR
jgi:hypothetical protein